MGALSCTQHIFASGGQDGRKRGPDVVLVPGTHRPFCENVSHNGAAARYRATAVVAGLSVLLLISAVLT
jgi:hypothetical protein